MLRRSFLFFVGRVRDADSAFVVEVGRVGVLVGRGDEAALARERREARLRLGGISVDEGGVLDVGWEFGESGDISRCRSCGLLVAFSRPEPYFRRVDLERSSLRSRGEFILA